MEPVNHWQPVTNEYEQEPAPFFEVFSPPKKKFREKDTEQGKVGQGVEVPIGITCITWFYFVRGCACFIFASLLFSRTNPNLVDWFVGHSRSMVPFQVSATESVPVTNLLAEGLILMGIFSVIVGAMWMVRYWRIRWITMCYAGLALGRTAFFFISDKAAGITTQLSTEQKQTLLISSIANLVILCYLAFYPGVEQAFEKSR